MAIVKGHLEKFQSAKAKAIARLNNEKSENPNYYVSVGQSQGYSQIFFQMNTYKGEENVSVGQSQGYSQILLIKHTIYSKKFQSAKAKAIARFYY